MIHGFMVRLLLAICLLICLAGCNYEIKPLAGTDGRTQVYVAAGKLGVPNAGIICTSIGCVIIDPMLSPIEGEQLQADALIKSKIFWDNLHTQRKERKHTLAPPVLYVLNTTFRGSHTFGNQAFNKADIISTPKAKMRLEVDGRVMREELRDQWHVPGLENHAITPATLTADGVLNLDTPEIKIQFISVGDCVGEGDAVVFLPIQKVLFAGDLIIPGYIPYYKSRSLTVRHWIEILKKLETWDIDIVIPGHGDFYEVKRRNLIKEQREFLEALVSEVELSIKSGKTMEQTAEAVKLPKYLDWRYREWIPANANLVFRELNSGPSTQDGKMVGSGAGVVLPIQIEPADGFREK